jgi:hypothetical protein
MQYSTVQYESKEPAAAALLRPTMQNRFVHLKMANYAETCYLCILYNKEEKKREEMHIDEKNMPKDIYTHTVQQGTAV